MVFIVQVYQTSQYAVLHDGIFLSKWGRLSQEVLTAKRMSNQPAL
jgi:hypothetical protein